MRCVSTCSFLPFHEEKKKDTCLVFHTVFSVKVNSMKIFLQKPVNCQKKQTLEVYLFLILKIKTFFLQVINLFQHNRQNLNFKVLKN